MLHRMKLISDKLLVQLPFSAESLLSWREDTDLHSFLSELSDHEGTIIMSDGRRETVNYVDYGDFLYEQGTRDFRSWAHRFTQSAEKSVGSYKGLVDSIELPDFYEHHSFGTLAKHIVAYEGIVHTALQSGVFFSIAHINESMDDLRCSLMLASELYYKHALQVLWSFLEDLVLPVYFATNPNAYVSWRENNYRTPPLRGAKKGILTGLVKGRVLDDELAGEVSDLYGNLNSFIHGSERRLVNKGHYTRNWVGHAFNMDDYLEWCSYVTAAVILAAHLLQVNLAQWEAFRTQSKVVCPICHNDEDFSTEEFVFGGEQFTRYNCQTCGDEMTHSFNGRQAYSQNYKGEIISYQY